MDSVLITLSFLYPSTYFMFYFLTAPIKILTFLVYEMGLHKCP